VKTRYHNTQKTVNKIFHIIFTFFLRLFFELFILSGMRGKKLTVIQLQSRTRKELGSSSHSSYMKWWRARIALGLPIKGRIISQASLLRRKK